MQNKTTARFGLIALIAVIGFSFGACKDGSDTGGDGTAPRITTDATLPGGTVDTPYSQQLVATGTAPIKWSLDSGSTLPAGLSLAATTGVISGTPTAANTFSFTVKATNAAGSNTKQLSITIASAGDGTAPTITIKSLPGGTVGEAYNETLTATSDTSVTWSIDGDLPDGLRLEGSDITGTPTEADTFTFNVTATNATASDTKQLSITIEPADDDGDDGVAPEITTEELPGGTVGEEYSQQLVATGTATIKWSLDSGSTLPADLSLAETGIISGTPETSGTFTFTVKAANTAGHDTKSLSITIVTVPEITTEKLPNGTVGREYNQTLTATGYAVTWSIEDGDLPDGLGLDTETGDITGTPEEEGAFEFTVKAINAAGNDTKDLTITIVIPLIETVPIQGGTFTMGSPEDETFRTETQHDVTLTGFRMGKYQVTQAQYVAVIGSNPSAHTAGGLRSIYVMGLTTTGFPVETVNWYDVIVFCNRLSMREGLIPAYEMQTAANSAVWSADPSTWGTVPFGNDTRWNAVRIATGSTGYRLPTEAQWEYACRAGTWGDNYSAYNTGDTLSDSTGWYTLNSGSRTHSVGEKPANAWGLYDMHGNVFEWCWDWFIAYEADSQTDPTGPLSGSFRMYRGGPWSGDTEILRSAFRGSNTPQSRLDTLGFRVALPAE